MTTSGVRRLKGLGTIMLVTTRFCPFTLLESRKFSSFYSLVGEKSAILFKENT